MNKIYYSPEAPADLLEIRKYVTENTIRKITDILFGCFMAGVIIKNCSLMIENKKGTV